MNDPIEKAATVALVVLLLALAASAAAGTVALWRLVL